MAGTKSSIIETIVRLADAYCVAAKRSRASVSKAIFGRGGQINALAAGKRDLNTSSAETALAWFSQHWPDGAAWPAHVPRPETSSPVPTQGEPPATEAHAPAPAGEGSSQTPDASERKVTAPPAPTSSPEPVDSFPQAAE